jgi:hypothetical protein
MPVELRGVDFYLPDPSTGVGEADFFHLVFG